MSDIQPKEIFDDMNCFKNGDIPWENLFNNYEASVKEIFNKCGQYIRSSFNGKAKLRTAIVYNQEHYRIDRVAGQYHLFCYSRTDTEYMKSLIDERLYYRACILASRGVITEDFFGLLFRFRVYYNTQKNEYFRQMRTSEGFDKQFHLSISILFSKD